MLFRLIGHAALRTRFVDAIARSSLPASLLLHGPDGCGKERLALWLGQRLLCAAPSTSGEPCGECQHCQYVLQGAHPDLQWYFPRPRLKDADPDVDDVIEDLTGAIGERLEGDGWWAPPEPMDSLYVATIRALVRRAALTPALADRKVIVVADADRMVPQEGREEAANAFLKLLEEPPRNTTVVLTSSAPGALLPTIRSRAVAIRVPLPTGDAAREIASHRAAPGASAASRTAASLLDAAVDPGARYRAALAQSGAGARGAYTETLNALSGLLHERTRAAAARGREDSARNTARAIAFVEDAKQLARQNVNPQVITARLLADLAPLVS